MLPATHMHTFRIGFLFALCAIILADAAAGQQRPRRSESFFGLHFDHHAQIDEGEVGETLTEGMIDSLLTAVKPDFIQVDTKGHPGIASYPTKAGSHVASFQKDPLRLLRDVTARHGVALYSHYSGVIDERAIALHPDWAVLNMDGTRNGSATSFYSPYVDEILIPQLKELSDYGIDGVWIDGDAWGARPDFRDEAKAEFRKLTGLEPPASQDDPNFIPYLEFTRTKFKEYVTHYLKAMRAYDPEFQITSNWAYSSFMPEPVTLDLDYLSGDVASGNTVYSAAFEARCLAPQGQFYHKPWDLMAWSFVYNFDAPLKKQSPKSTVHLLQEAAETISMGGGFQVYYTQNADLSIQSWIIPQAAAIGRFVRDRQPYVQGSVPVPQIALLYSADAYRRASKVVYDLPRGEADALRGYSALLLNGRRPFEILMEHHLQGRMDQYGLIVIPEWNYLEPAFRDSVLAYVRRGGNLLVAGVDAVKLFEKELDVRLKGEPKRMVHFLAHDSLMANVDARYQAVEVSEGVPTIGTVHHSKDMRSPFGIAASVTPFGKGKIGAIYSDLGYYYLHSSSPVHRDFVSDVVDRLFQNPEVRVEGRGPLHVALNRLNDRTVLNLINAGGQHNNPESATYDDLVPLGPQQVTLRTSKQPLSVTLQPGNRRLAFGYADGFVNVVVPQVAVHEILVVE